MIAVNKITILYKVSGVKLPDKYKQTVFIGSSAQSIKIIPYKLGYFWELNILLPTDACHVILNSRKWNGKQNDIYPYIHHSMPTFK